jgi:hypothetical protein
MTGDLTIERDGYQGPARLRVGSDQFEVLVELRGFFQPIDGRYHWYGRLTRNDRLAQALGGQRAVGVLATEEGAGPCEISEPDAWGRYRISGTSAPPFPVAAKAGTQEWGGGLP